MINFNSNKHTNNIISINDTLINNYKYYKKTLKIINKENFEIIQKKYY